MKSEYFSISSIVKLSIFLDSLKLLNTSGFRLKPSVFLYIIRIIVFYLSKKPIIVIFKIR